MSKNILENKNVFIFDMDGTLIDSLWVWNRTDATFIKNLTGIEVDEREVFRQRDEFLSTCTSDNPYQDYIKFLVEKYHMNGYLCDLIDYRIAISRELMKSIQLKPYSLELLTKLKEMDKKLVLATTGAEDSVDLLLHQIPGTKAIGEGLFDIVFNQKSVKNLKPNPEIHLKAQELLGFSLEEAIVIEDSYVGLEAAKTAGIDSIIVYDSHNDYYKDYLMKNASLYVESLENVYNLCLNRKK